MLYFICWNIGGLGDKLGHHDLQKYLFKNDVVVILETMKDKDFFINISGYEFHHFSRMYIHKNPKRASGGISVFIRSACSHVFNVVQDSELCVWVNTRNCLHNVFIGFTYIPPADPSYCSPDIADYYDTFTDEVIKRLKRGTVIICGDLNARTGIADDYLDSDIELLGN